MLAVAMPRKELGTRAEARTKEIERCLRMNPTFIFMIDTDQSFPNRAIPALLATGADVAVIDAPSHNANDSNVRYHPDGTLYYATISCCMIRASVFAKLPKPWFSSAYSFIEDGIKDGKIQYRVVEKYRDDNVGEDVYFIRKCMDAGLTVKVVTDLKCGHFDLGDL